MDPILELSGLSKVYPGGLKALDDVELTIRKGEIFALLGPNGAGKTTLIGAVCGLVRPSSGTIRAFGYDMASEWRNARSRIGLVPQELSTDMFEPVKRAVSYSRGLFGLAPDPARIEEILAREREDEVESDPQPDDEQEYDLFNSPAGRVQRPWPCRPLRQRVSRETPHPLQVKGLPLQDWW